jgi:hypothetical protein
LAQEPAHAAPAASRIPCGAFTRSSTRLTGWIDRTRICMPCPRGSARCTNTRTHEFSTAPHRHPREIEAGRRRTDKERTNKSCSACFKGRQWARGTASRRPSAVKRSISSEPQRTSTYERLMALLSRSADMRQQLTRFAGCLSASLGVGAIVLYRYRQVDNNRT